MTITVLVAFVIADRLAHSRFARAVPVGASTGLNTSKPIAACLRVSSGIRHLVTSKLATVEEGQRDVSAAGTAPDDESGQGALTARLSRAGFTPVPARSFPRPRWVAPVRRVGRLAVWDRPGGWRIPALDGLRAIAVALVLASHGSIPAYGRRVHQRRQLRLGSFSSPRCCSTRLGRTGRIDLSGFWIRRARRLLPALVLMVCTVSAARTARSGPARPAAPTATAPGMP